ncbi:protochlorophyllide-dependent translocon component 52, chloroplastic-like [Mercurialis annua]|uniref:protochlorophyllide-dependent translocon component 52, chloroplastic-like n=1 Tax=Mercurialis annua TaxID=3986 RepID=UPI00215E0C1F|nr:protochlorophyllide-dependent translocon component 52, chloroplastic-like [Mercurialis annua]
MEALKAFCFRITTPTTLHTTQIFHLQSSSKPTHWIHKNTLTSKLFSTLSSSPSAVSENPTNPNLETENEEEKYDWFGQWYPIMPVCDLDKRVPHAKTVMGVDVVVWWDKNESSWNVFDDACPHRLAPLSEGRIDQWGRLQCVYHGWCFNGSGDCKFIPQAPPDGPPVHTFKKACVASYPCVVQNEIVWFWPNSSAEYKDILSREKPPYISELDDPSYTKSMSCREFPYGYEILIENLVDPAHVPYAHYKLLPNPPSKNSVRLDREGGSPLDLNIEKFDKNGFFSTRFGGESKFIAPCTYYSAFSLPPPAKAGNAAVSSGGNNKEPLSNVPRRRGVLLFFCVPVGPGKSRLIYAFPRNFGVSIGRIIPRWVSHLMENLVLDSDLYLLHLEERKIMDVGALNWQKACFVPTKSDAQVIAFRKWLRRYSDGQINWGVKFSEAVPPSPPKEQLMDRYRSHVVNCSSCSVAYKRLNALEVGLQVLSIVIIGIVAASKQSLTSAVARTGLVLMAVICFAASKWLGHFIYKSFHFHDYNHALL